MVVAYVFIIVKPGSRAEVTSADFLKSEGVKDVTEVYGEYDVVVKIQAKDIAELTKIIKNFRKIDGVEKTTTMIGIQ